MSANDNFSLHDDEELSLNDDASLAGSVPASNKGDAPAKPPQIITTNTLSNIKLPVLQKDDYDTWANGMEHNLVLSNEVWKVIQNGELKRSESPKDVFMAWMMPKRSRQPSKHDLVESLERKVMIRFQILLSQLDALGAGVSDEDANHKFLRVSSPALGQHHLRLTSDNVAFLSQAKASSSKHKPSHSSGSYSSYNTSSSKATTTATPGLADEGQINWVEQTTDEELNHALMAFTNWNQGMQRDLGTGYSFERKPCFVCGSLSHLIKDCDYYEKKMAREAAFKSTRVVHANSKSHNIYAVKGKNVALAVLRPQQRSTRQTHAYGRPESQRETNLFLIVPDHSTKANFGALEEAVNTALLYLKQGSKEVLILMYRLRGCQDLMLVSLTSLTKATRKAVVSEKIATKKTHSPKQPSSTPISKSADDIMTFRKELDALALKHLGPVLQQHLHNADHEEEVFSDADDDEMLEIRIYDKSSEGIFEKASYDDDGIITDFNTLPDKVLNGYTGQKDERGVVVRNKARLVAQGHRQEEWINYDEVFAHVARIEAIGCMSHNPPGFVVILVILQKFYKVDKALYGLHQALELADFIQKGEKDFILFTRVKFNDVRLTELLTGRESHDSQGLKDVCLVEGSGTFSVDVDVIEGKAASKEIWKRMGFVMLPYF
ncbi:retrovirus-related pol polyprotein from transposon TNT 1-94 [Tanacetum coccineum]